MQVSAARSSSSASLAWGQGKSGGYRALIAFRKGERAVFLYGFAKSERGNIQSDRLAELKLYAQRWLGLGDEEIASAMTDGDLREVHCDEATEDEATEEA